MKRTLIAVAALLLLPAFCQAQTGSLTVMTNPPGAAVQVDGEVSVSGVSPVTFTYPLEGIYDLRINKQGYESYSARLVIDPTHPQQIDIKLAPRTTTRAVARSLVIPGWGQLYSGQKTKAFIFGGLFVGAAVNLYDRHDRYHDRRDTYNQRLLEYDAALTSPGSVDDLTRLHESLMNAQQAAYDAESDRRTAIAVALGVWGLNLIDAVLFTPSERATFSIKGLSVIPSADQHSAGITLTMAF